MSLPDPAMNLLNAEYNALLTPQARTRFLSSYTGMAADRVERIDQSGSPWPGTPAHGGSMVGAGDRRDMDDPSRELGMLHQRLPNDHHA